MGLHGVFLKSVILLNLKVSCGIPREQVLLRKSETPRKSPAKWTFLSLSFYDAPSLHTVEKGSCTSFFGGKNERSYAHKLFRGVCLVKKGPKQMSFGQNIFSLAPRHKTNISYMQEKILRNCVVCECMRGLYSQSREYIRTFALSRYIWK